MKLARSQSGTHVTLSRSYELFRKDDIYSFFPPDTLVVENKPVCAHPRGYSVGWSFFIFRFFAGLFVSIQQRFGTESLSRFFWYLDFLRKMLEFINDF